jgi:hypothetical protein
MTRRDLPPRKLGKRSKETGLAFMQLPAAVGQVVDSVLLRSNPPRLGLETFGTLAVGPSREKIRSSSSIGPRRTSDNAGSSALGSSAAALHRRSRELTKG